jgi:putative long chain acyl-CoA synthase
MTPLDRALRLVSTARNVAEVVRLGGLQTDEESSPYTVVAEQLNYRLRHYFADVPEIGTAGRRRPVLLVPPLMMSAEVWDVSPATSAVAALHAAGLDPWVVDFGDPGDEPGGLKRNLTDHVLAVSDAVDRVHAAVGVDLLLGGYSQGGMFCYQTAALRHGKHIDSLITFGSPVDTTAPLPVPISPERVARLAAEVVDSGILRRIALPSWATRLGFKLLDPVKTVQGRVKFLLALNDRDALLPRERQRRFLDSEGWTAYAGPAIAEFLEQFVAHNRMLEGGFVIDDRLVTLADIELPVLSVVGTTDNIGHPDSVRAIRRAAPRAEVYELTLNAGHFGLVVGGTASRRTWPAVAAWARWRSGEAELPDDVKPADEVESKVRPPGAAAAALGQAADLYLDAGRIAVRSAKRAVRTAGSLVGAAPAQLPRLARLQQLQPNTRISLGLLLDEQAAKHPDEVCFLFGDRAYRQHEVKHRVDSVVRGLIGAGVRQGDRVGVLMGTRPSSFTVVAALSRIGATAVLLRPEGDLVAEATLAAPTWVISDPEHADGASALPGVHWAVLGNSGSDRSGVVARVVDLELVDVEAVELPAWYRPNPQRAADTAFVLFAGEGSGTRALEISNGRWARSALGTASAAALRPGDTVYSTTPHHHSSALLMSVGGAVAAGARFAVASGTDPATFWAEARRYGATHVSYTWASLRDITLAKADPAERYHPIRMFIGSGMPANLWRRVADRFPTTKVLEFYASAEGNAILANLAGTPIGSLGTPLPGTVEVRIVAFDQRAREIALGPDGLARECEPGEVGLLLARAGTVDVEPQRAGAPDPLYRGLFEPDDAWQSTGDLFTLDDDGQLWLVDGVSALVDTVHGPVAPAVARRAVEAIPAVDLGVAYGVPGAGGAQELVVSLTLRPGTELTAAELDRVCDRLPPGHRPDHVQVVDSIPLTAWSRPIWRELREAGTPQPGPGVFRLTDDRSHYREG